MTVVLIVSILVLILIQSAGDLRGRADFARCVTNLRSLYVAAGSYVQDQEHWPQIDPRLNKGGNTQYAELWYDALKKYGISRQGWVCPTTQRELKHPDLDEPSNHRVDYIATPFDDRTARRPYQWSTQPWFIEKGYSHPGGNLIIYSDGQTMPLKEALRRTNQGG